MNDSGPFFFIACVLAAVAVALIIAGITYSTRNHEMHRFASIWRGRIERGGPWDFPRVAFQLGESRTVLSYSQSGDDGVRTHLTISLYDVRLRLELRPQGIGSRIGKFLGMQDIEIGAAEFDDAFIIQGSNEKGIREFLTPAVQAAILGVANGGGGKLDLHLQLGGGSLRLTKHQHLSSEEDLSQFVRACFVLLRQIQKPISDGIQFVDKPQQQQVLVKDTQCQVCGDPLQDKVVYCMKCKTPHHLDCWQYFGSCSVYGCGQKRYIVFKP